MIIHPEGIMRPPRTPPRHAGGKIVLGGEYAAEERKV